MQWIFKCSWTRFLHRVGMGGGHVCLWVDLAKLVPWMGRLRSSLLGT